MEIVDQAIGAGRLPTGELLTRRDAVLRGSAALFAVWFRMSLQTANAQTAAEHYVFFDGPINDTNTSRLMSIVGTLVPKPLKELHLIVGTSGGNIPDALMAYGFLRALPVKVTTYNLSTVASAGTIIYLAGEKRISVPSAFFQFHRVTQSFSRPPASMTLEDFTGQKNALAMNLERMEQIYKERTALLPQQIEEFQRQDVFFDAQEAHKAGIVHEIAALAIPAGAAITIVNTAATQQPR
jgi:ATP-dependent Clp protease, protease subunit